MTIQTDRELLAPDHKGMKVDYIGLLQQVQKALEYGSKEPVLAEMVRQLTDHLQELGVRWYAGDTTVVDALLQLYCVKTDARKALKAAIGQSMKEQK